MVYEGPETSESRRLRFVDMGASSLLGVAMMVVSGIIDAGKRGTESVATFCDFFRGLGEGAYHLNESRKRDVSKQDVVQGLDCCRGTTHNAELMRLAFLDARPAMVVPIATSP